MDSKCLQKYFRAKKYEMFDRNTDKSVKNVGVHTLLYHGYKNGVERCLSSRFSMIISKGRLQENYPRKGD